MPSAAELMALGRLIQAHQEGQAGLGPFWQAPARGMMEPGNIDLYSRPQVRNSDGSISTVRSMSFGAPEGEVLVPTVSDEGRLISEQEAMDAYHRTGRHLGLFNDPRRATEYAKRLHDEQARYYLGRGRKNAR